MGFEDTFEYYKLIKYHVQLLDISLVELICKQSEESEDEKLNLRVRLATKSLIVSEKKVEVFLRVNLDFEKSGPFDIQVEYKGVCETSEDITDEELENQAKDLTVSLLLPYARECISTTMNRMGISPILLPTMDILNSMAANSEQHSEG